MSRTAHGLLMLVGVSFLACPALARAEKKHPAEEKGLKSTASEIESKVKFDNKSGTTIKVHWIDFDGKRKLYKILKDGESYEQNTFMSHPWIVTDEDDNAWHIYFADAQPRTVEVAAPKKK